MDKGDVEFTVSLNTSPAERQLEKLEKRMKASSHIYSGVFRDMGPGGFKMVGQPYQNSNNYGVPSTQVLERSLSVFTNSMERFARVIDSISARMVNFTTVGSPYNQTPRTIYASNNRPNIAGYLPYDPSIGYTMNYQSRPQGPTDPNKVFDMLVQKRKAEQSSPYMGVYGEFSRRNSAQGMYNTFMSVFGNTYDATRGVLGLPAPKKSPVAEDNSTPQEQAKDVVEEDKKDNDELKGKLLLWGKILATVYALRKVLEGLGKLWKFGAETVSGVNSNINEESGFFSTDPEGALRANSDKTRAMLYAGIRNMGSNAPVSKSGLDYASSKFTEMWTAAMSGRNVDARTTIDAQRLKEFFGVDFTVAGLLTGEREGKTATDIQIDLMNSIEKNISKLAEADDVTKGQVIDSMKNILGSELVDAIVANANKNLKIETPELRVTVSEMLMSHGGSAIPQGNLTEETAKSVKAISDFNDAVQQLKNTITTELSPVFSALTKALTSVVTWIDKKFNRVEASRNANGEIEFKTSIASLTNDRNSYGVYKQNTKADKTDKFENKKDRLANDLKSNNVYDKLETLWLSQVEAENASNIENLGIKAMQDVIGKKMLGGRLNRYSANPIEKALANYSKTYKGKTYYGMDAFRMEGANESDLGWWNDSVNRLFNNPGDMSESEKIQAYLYFLEHNPEAKEAFKNAFTEGGKYDYNTKENVAKYLLNPSFYSSGEEYLNAMKELSQQSIQVMDNVLEVTPTWNDKDKNGRVDFGEVVITVVTKDQYGKVLSTDELQGAVQ